MTARPPLGAVLGAMVKGPSWPCSRSVRALAMALSFRLLGLGIAAGLVCVVIPATLQPAPAFARVDPYAQGRALYDKNRLQDALPLLERAAASNRRDADVLALLAETYRRLGRPQEAERTGRRALALAPRHSFALSVMGHAFNPQYGDWEGANTDSAWAYLRAAVACDSAEGHAWEGIAIEALRREEFDVERTALRQLVNSGFLRPPVLAFSRWLLRDLPDSSVLLVNGDMDTYPTRALQEVEGLRPDVAIVNLPLLELGWYRRMVRDRYRVPMPFDPLDLDELEPIRGPRGTWVYSGKRVVRGWFAMLEAGTLGRPLAIAITVPDRDFGHDASARQVLAGAFWLVAVEPTPTLVDSVRVWASLLSLRPKDFTGPWLHARSRSPVLRASTPTLANNIVTCAALYFTACQQAGRTSDARAVQAWASDFAREAEIDPFVRIAIQRWGKERTSSATGRNDDR